MKIKWLVFLMLGVLLMDIVGCATITKKFKRKSKRKPIQPVVFTERSFVPEYSNKYYYKTHYTHWKTWHNEWIAYLSRNAKRERRAAGEVLGHLDSMQKLLDETKAQELQGHIDAIQKISKRIRTTSREEQVGTETRLTLNRTKRQISSNFYYEKVKEHLLPDDIDLSAP